MKIVFLYVLLGICQGATIQKKFTPPKWEGHWEAYSERTPTLLIATLDIEKVKGKEYTWKLWMKNDEQRYRAEGECPVITYNGTAIYNGANGLDTGLKGIGFVYYQETGKINMFHDFSSDELTAVSDCMDADFYKK
jgi:hypothetical protein